MGHRTEDGSATESTPWYPCHTSFYNFKKVAEAAVTFFEDKDVFRIITADRQAQLATKESRKRGRLKRLGSDEDQARRHEHKEEEGIKDDGEHDTVVLMMSL